MKSLCDLHTHSVFSDGTDTPAEILRLSVDAGLSAVALCDHNTVDGLPDFLASADSSADSASILCSVSVSRIHSSALICTIGISCSGAVSSIAS